MKIEPKSRRGNKHAVVKHAVVKRPGSGKIRIIGGRWRGTRLSVPDAPGLRPTSDRVRETLFNWLQPVLSGARVLDLFAGSGALGLEALSRGGREALLVESSPDICEALRTVIDRLGATDSARVLRADVPAFLRAPLHGHFDLVFLDPPFSSELWPAVLERLPPWLAEDAWIYLEMPLEAAPTVPADWHLHRDGRTREVHHVLYRRSGDGADTLPPSQCDSSAALV